MLTTSTPAAWSSRAASMVRSMRTDRGGSISTQMTNRPSASARARPRGRRRRLEAGRRAGRCDGRRRRWRSGRRSAAAIAARGGSVAARQPRVERLRASRAMCSGVVPQQPPMIARPGGQRCGAPSRRSSRAGGVDELALDPRRQPGVGHDRRGAGAGAHRGQRVEAALRARAAVDADASTSGGGERAAAASPASCRRAARASSPKVIEATIGRSRRGRARLLDGEQQVRRAAQNVSSTKQVDAALEQALDLSPGTAARTAASPQVERGRGVGAPSGPIDPPTSTSRRPRRAPRGRAGRRAALSRPARSARPYGARRMRLAPNVRSRSASAPASTYSRWMAPIRSGRVATSSSRRPAAGCPRLKSSVPIAPSSSSGPAASRSRKRALVRPSRHERSVHGRPRSASAATAER